MSARARRATAQAVVLPYAWQSTGLAMPLPAVATPALPPASAASATAQADGQLAALERDAFAQGFAQGERAGAEAAAVQAEAMLRRMAQAIDEIAGLRHRIARDTEQQMVQLALTVARRIIQREVSIDRELVMAIARVAIDRVGEAARVTVRLNPDDYAVIVAANHQGWPGGHVTLIADTRLPRGGCRVESELGNIDAGIEAQLQEMTQALLQDAPVTVNANHR
jgi:flagellar assembly protein FliH